MKKLEIITRPESYDNIKEVLNKNNCSGMTMLNVMGCGMQKGGALGGSVNLLPKIQINAVIEDDSLETIMAELRESISQGKVGDGKVFVYDVYDAMRIRTGERGKKAISSPFKHD